MPTSLTDPLNLPCGARLANRVAKSAITEGLADERGWPTERLERLYAGWAESGFGLMISGNVIVDGDHLERPGNVIIDRPPTQPQMAWLKRWTRAARSQGAHFWAQLSHSGRQTPKTVNDRPLSVSGAEIDLPLGLFGRPQAMTPDEVERVVDQFAMAAEACKAAGFTGVQIHAAHGYLLSTFLNPKVNTRADEWGGSLANRSRALIDVVAAVRHAVGANFPVGVKLNSADFQKGGFEVGDSEAVALALEAAGVDLLEISGGSYENPAMIGLSGGAADSEAPARKASTVAREAYFLDFARALRRRLTMPVMLTGGLRTRAGMQAALDEGVDVVGIARPVCVDLAGLRPLLLGERDTLDLWEEQLRRDRSFFGVNSPISAIRTLAGFSTMHWFYAQLYRHGRGEAPATKLWPLKAMMEVMGAEKRLLGKRKRLLAAEAEAEPAPTLPRPAPKPQRRSAA